MDFPESQVHSFIVKLWVKQSGHAGWTIEHGYVTRVPDGERRYLRNVSEITDFIESSLGQMEDEAKVRSPFHRWLKRFNS